MKPLKLTNVRKGGINSLPTTVRPNGAGTTKLNTKNQRSPVCPHCGYQCPYKKWHVPIEDGDTLAPVICIRCDHYFVATGNVVWSTRKYRKRKDEEYDDEPTE